MKLADHLILAYDRSIGRASPATMQAFVDELKADPDLKAEAAAKLASLTDAVCMKCHCSRTHKAALADALRRAA